MQGPFVADEHGDVRVLADLRAVAAAIEAVDVDAGEYVFFDATGLALEGYADERGSVGLRPVRPPQRRPEELADRLRGFLSRVRDRGGPLTGAQRAALSPGADLPQFLAAVLDTGAERVRRRGL